jgi:signal transduction histidine kinase
MLGKDDVFQGSMIILAGLVILIAVVSMLALNQVKQRIWKPFYQTLNTIRQHKIEDPPPNFPETDIDEFMQLNKTLQGFMKKMSDDFRNNKAFNENASHELQTHLAVIRANTEKLINESGPGAPGLEELGRINESAGKLSRIQKSLMLLSRIHNREFSNLVPLDLKKVLDSALPVFEDPISLRNIQTTIGASQCPLVMDEGLAEILVGNLVKNAVKYNVPEGYIRIALNPQRFEIANSGKPFDGDPAILTQRFAKGPDGNTGIGLAIVGQICELYGFRLSYQVENKTEHKITVFFGS